MKQGFRTSGRFRFHFKIRDKVTGKVQEFVDEAPNVVTNQGLNHLLGVGFNNQTQVHPWYLGLKLTGVATYTDTYSIMLSGGADWDEFEEYSGHRKEFWEGAASGQQISNTGSVGTFDITSAGVVYGALLTSVESKTENPATAVLFSAADIASFRTVDSGDQINITYTITASGG